MPKVKLYVVSSAPFDRILVIEGCGVKAHGSNESDEIYCQVDC